MTKRSAIRINKRRDLFADNDRYRDKCHNAAMLAASVEPSDPFLYKRIMNNLRYGAARYSDVYDDAATAYKLRQQQLAAEAPERERTALALKKHFGLA